MNIFNEEIDKELSRIKEKIANSITLTEEDLKIILLSKLSEEDLNESHP